MAVAGNMWCRGSWDTGHSKNTDGETSTKMTKAGERIYFYAGPTTDSLPLLWDKEPDFYTYAVYDDAGNPGGPISIYAEATGTVWGMVSLLNADGDVVFEHDLHAATPHSKFNETFHLGKGNAVMVKRSD